MYIPEEENHKLECVSRCKKCCRVGFGFPCKQEDDIKIYCNKCDRTFYNTNCYQSHKNKICDLYHRCLACHYEYRTNEEHTCGEKRCQTCFVTHDPERSCFIQKYKIPKKNRHYRIVAYDLECTTDGRQQ